ncbi:MAG: DNA replication/repair protein RecF [Clostridiales bacterium]|nr:DNA replication/repair protein RecF [Clostridiales bacterium]
MRIKKLKVENFRNLENLDIEFSEGVNIIYGNNAQGKTNIIESIYIFSFGKSFRANKDIELLKFDKEYFLSNIEIMKKDRELEMDFGFDKISNKKMIKVNGVIQKKISDIIGKLNVVVFKPEDIKIVTDSPSIRRKYIDYLISSISKSYLENITKYKKVMEERNNLLKEIKLRLKGSKNLDETDSNFLDVYDKLLSKLNCEIYNERKRVIEKLNNYIYDIHLKLTENYINNEKLHIKYVSNVAEDIEKMYNNLSKSRPNDINKGYTSLGIHRDDYIISINSLDVSIYGSQGQKKSSIISLKLSELKVIEEVIGEKPVLLLDDYMSELDEKRRLKFLDIIEDIQIIITTTHKISIDGKENTYFYVDNGKIEREKNG